jgi:hypothetical protein
LAFQVKNARDMSWAFLHLFILDGAKINLPSGKIIGFIIYPVESDGNDVGDVRQNILNIPLKTILKDGLNTHPVATNVAGR